MGSTAVSGAVDILVIGGGGREHALAWKLRQSPRVGRIFFAPGNGAATSGDASGIRALPIAESDTAALIKFALREDIGLVVVGPEAPLAAGAVDEFAAAGIRCFGPSRAAARLETSKAFAKGFMARHGIPTAQHAAFTDMQAALAYFRASIGPVVIKASGLAAGKGVILPADQGEGEAAIRAIMETRRFGAAGDEVIIEERLTGREVSLLGFCDGRTVVPMPPAQDHKRLLDGDLGPNTGGMGAYAPVPWLTAEGAAELTAQVLQPAVEGMAAEGTPYRGVLYAGLMLTSAGPDVLEYNCRFGDPETQALLPLLQSDLIDVIEACLDGSLNAAGVRWHPGSAATVVAASEGYPGQFVRGLPITGVDAAEALPGVTVFHGGTRRVGDGALQTNGGRVLAVTGTAEELPQSLSRAYAGMERIQFAGMHYRRDIGAGAVNHGN